MIGFSFFPRLSMPAVLYLFSFITDCMHSPCVKHRRRVINFNSGDEYLECSGVSYLRKVDRSSYNIYFLFIQLDRVCLHVGYSNSLIASVMEFASRKALGSHGTVRYIFHQASGKGPSVQHVIRRLLSRKLFQSEDLAVSRSLKSDVS